MSSEELEQQKEIEFYSAGVNAWYSTSLEHDKSIMALSAGGIGLLVTLLTTDRVSSFGSAVLYSLAITSFLVSLAVVLVIFKRNRNYIESVLLKRKPVIDPCLKMLDLIAICSFGVGVMFAAIIGIAAAVNSYVKTEKTMADEKVNPASTVPFRESFNGSAKLQPGADETRSFHGVGNLQPQPSASTPAPASTPAESTPAPAPAGSSQTEGSGKNK